MIPELFILPLFLSLLGFPIFKRARATSKRPWNFPAPPCLLLWTGLFCCCLQPTRVSILAREAPLIRLRITAACKQNFVQFTFDSRSNSCNYRAAISYVPKLRPPSFRVPWIDVEKRSSFSDTDAEESPNRSRNYSRGSSCSRASLIRAICSRSIQSIQTKRYM